MILEVMSRYEFQRYIEIFGGSGAILFAKEPSKCEVYNDVFGNVVTLYKVLRNPHQFKQLLRLIESTPYSREVFDDSRRALEDNTLSEVERAWHFFVCARQSFSNLLNSFSTPSESSRTVAAITYQRAIDRLPEIHERLKHVHIENLDAIECIKRYANPNCLMYLDPPYIHSTRVAPKSYKYEYTDEQHQQLVETILSVPGHKILSGYESPIYQPLLDAGWTLEKKQMCCHASGRSKKTYRTECLYCSPVKCKPTIRSNTMNKHPNDRRVFFTRQGDNFLSLNEVRDDTLAGTLSLLDTVFDVDGGSYSVESIVMGKAPKWAMTAEHDPMLHDLPPFSEEDAAMVNELLCEPDFLEMPSEPQVKTVKDYLANEPRIARMVAGAARCMF